MLKAIQDDVGAVLYIFHVASIKYSKSFDMRKLWAKNRKSRSLSCKKHVRKKTCGQTAISRTIKTVFIAVKRLANAVQFILPTGKFRIITRFLAYFKS